MQTINGDDGRSPWHAGEREAQERAGVTERADALGRRSIRTYLIDQHRDFFAQLPFLVAGWRDGAGRPWASILSGAPGFLGTPDPHRLTVAPSSLSDIPDAALTVGSQLGLLGIEPATRRRNRLNGRIEAAGPDGFTVGVEQSFGNCPRFIEPRGFDPFVRADGGRIESWNGLDPAARALIETSDTFFIATASNADGVDVSHRGGPPGFVEIAEDGALLVPDYAGNRFFNTIGNLMVDPRAGLLFIDMKTGDRLSLTGATEILWGGAEVAARPGAERLVRFRPVEGRWLRGA